MFFADHAMLWSVGIRRCGISESNLIWDSVAGKSKLCDFDLSHFCAPPEVDVAEVGPDGPMGLSNTGTWIFMAEELLEDEAMDGRVKRVYRHEVEAFVNVLVWIACRYVNGKLKAAPPFEEWNHRDYLGVSQERKKSLRRIRDGKFPQPSGLPDDLWHAIQSTVFELELHLLAAREAAREAQRFIDLGPYRRSRPNPYSTRVVGVPEDYDDLRALHMIVGWPVFEHQSSAALYAGLIQERILSASQAQSGPTV